MRKKLKSIGSWIGLRAPYIGIIFVLLVFVINGSVSVEGEDAFQISALIIALLQIASLIFPSKSKLVLTADLLTVFWMFVWGWEVYQQLYPKKAGWFAVLMTPVVGIFVAFGAPIRARIFRPRPQFRKTPNYGENLSPHFSDARNRKG